METTNTTTRFIAFIRKYQQRLAASHGIAIGQGDVEAIHRLRVSSRRLNEPLRISAAWLSTKKAKRLRRDMRNVRRAFRHVRDLDVLGISLTDERTAPAMSAHDLAHLEGVITTQRQRELEAACQQVDTQMVDQLDRRLTRLTERFRDAVDEPRRLREQLAESWQQRYDELNATFPATDASATLHPLRLCLKRLRYITELLYLVDDRQHDRVLEAICSMQDLLGAWNDDVFASEALSGLATQTGVLVGSPGWAGSVLDYAAHRARLAAAGRSSVHQHWPTLARTLAAARIAHATLADPTTSG